MNQEQTIDIALEKNLLRNMRQLISQGNLESVKPYFFDGEVTRNDIYGDLEHNINSAFLCAVSYEKIDIMSYLLTSSELSKHANIHTGNDNAIFWAAENGNIKAMEYLLYSSELKEHISLDCTYLLEELFDSLIAQFYIEDEDYYSPGSADAYSINDKVVLSLDYLIHEVKIKPTEHIIKLIDHETHGKFRDEALIELNKNLVYYNLMDKTESQSDKVKTKKNKL